MHIDTKGNSVPECAEDWKRDFSFTQPLAAIGEGASATFVSSAFRFSRAWSRRPSRATLEALFRKNR
jgi:hypothetical protein